MGPEKEFVPGDYKYGDNTAGGNIKKDGLGITEDTRSSGVNGNNTNEGYDDGTKQFVPEDDKYGDNTAGGNIKKDGLGITEDTRSSGVNGNNTNEGYDDGTKQFVPEDDKYGDNTRSATREKPLIPYDDPFDGGPSPRGGLASAKLPPSEPKRITHAEGGDPEIIEKQRLWQQEREKGNNILR